MPPHTITQILDLLYKALLTWAQQSGNGAVVTLARDPFQVL